MLSPDLVNLPGDPSTQHTVWILLCSLFPFPLNHCKLPEDRWCAYIVCYQLELPKYFSVEQLTYHIQAHMTLVFMTLALPFFPFYVSVLRNDSAVSWDSLRLINSFQELDQLECLRFQKCVSYYWTIYLWKNLLCIEVMRSKFIIWKM